MTFEELKPAPNDDLQRWMVSKRVNSSKARQGRSDARLGREAGGVTMTGDPYRRARGRRAGGRLRQQLRAGNC
jgi:hypothetical protein